MCGTHGALMGAKQPAFEQRDHAVDTRQQFGGDGGVSAKERHTMVVPGLDPFVAVPSIGVYFAARCDDIVVERPCALPPPTKVSSPSTRPERRSRPGRIMARRSLCSHVHAV